MSTPVLATKLYPPAHRPHLVARPRLTGRLDTTLEPGNRLTLVCAPAGFGKTTVLSDWLSGLGQREPPVRVAWLSLDEGDNDLPRLLSHLVAGLRGAGLEVDQGVLGALTAASTPGALVALLNDVTRLGAVAPGGHWVLVLDDYHLVEATETHEAVAFLAEHLPGHLHLVVATRSDPPLPLARMRARGQLTELRAADLRFTSAEAQEFLTRTMSLDLSTADVEALDERTEGWVAGLQLAALSLRGLEGREEVAGFIRAFTGSHRFVVDYLVDEVLARQPGEVRDFLLDTAVLDRLSAPLCDAVAAREGSALLLRQLERDNLFLVPLDAERVWYRYHHLFADVLRARLLADHPGRVHHLHGRASDWHASRGHLPDAVSHALAAEDLPRAARLMEEGVPQLRRTRQDGLLMSWVGSLPDELVCRSPVLSILSAWSRLMSGDLDGVESRLDDAEAALAAAGDDPALAASWADTEDLRTAPGMIAMYRASVAQARGDVAGTVRHAQRALQLVGPEDHFVRGAGSGFLGLAAWAAGDVAGALSTFTDAVRSLHAAGNLVDELDSTVVLADMWLAQGRPGRARRLFDQGLDTATRAGAPYLRASADFHVGLAELDRELDDLDSARAHLETARVLGERASITENRHRWFVASALVAAAEGDTEAALRLLDEAESLYRRGFYPETRPIPALRSRLLIAGGELDAAARWAEERGLGTEDDPAYLQEYEHLTLVRLLLARHEITAALGVLDRLDDAAAGAGRDGSVQEIGVLQALAHHLHDDLPHAVEALGRTWGRAPEPDAYVRLYLDEGEPMAALLHDVARTPRHTVGAAVGDQPAEEVLARARRLVHPSGATDPASPDRPAWPAADPLSRRELEVLRLLDSELTGPEIARQLYVSLNTLRTHTKRIFTKLDVRTRGAAVRRAHEQGLL